MILLTIGIPSSGYLVGFIGLLRMEGGSHTNIQWKIRQYKAEQTTYSACLTSWESV